MNSLTVSDKKHFKSFVKYFSPSKALQERWTYFCSKNKASYWGGIEPMKFWEISCTQYKTTDLSKVPMIDWVKSPLIAQSFEKIKEVMMIACGNSDPHVERFNGNEFFSLGFSNLPIEYVVSLIPGQLVLVANHDGETLLLSR